MEKPCRSARWAFTSCLLAFARASPRPWSRREPASGLRGDLVAEPEGPFDRDPLEAEGLVGEDLDPLPLLEARVQAGDLGDLLRGELLALVPRLLRILIQNSRASTSWTLPRRRLRLAVGHDPEVGGDAGVVEELVGQGDDGLQPVVLDDPAADLGLARARRRR